MSFMERFISKKFAAIFLGLLFDIAVIFGAPESIKNEGMALVIGAINAAVALYIYVQGAIDKIKEGKP